ncbi:type II toxin-antitoxin system PemK/MazF family toxin [Botryobacter ruber]|uniref:type II toxin-antitoxin system PemK/MazF family toxin n=1 Tax=Botryobacter ruber TaxID=2171629 RepID=UPI000E0ACDD4|nr:type II toxin-antitoxin system PemK/MazF family toxin [Botryobacter ruber]
MTYNRGDVVWIKFPFTDLTQQKLRPALIISNQVVNRTGDYILVQITSKERNDVLSIRINDNNYSEAPLLVQSYLRLQKIFTLHESLLSGKQTAVTEDFIADVVNSVNTLLSKDQEANERHGF